MDDAKTIQLQVNFIEMQHHTIAKLQEELTTLWKCQEMEQQRRIREDGEMGPDEFFFSELEGGAQIHTHSSLWE